MSQSNPVSRKAQPQKVSLPSPTPGGRGRLSRGIPTPRHSRKLNMSKAINRMGWPWLPATPPVAPIPSAPDAPPTGP